MEILHLPSIPELEPLKDAPPPDVFDRYRYYILGGLLIVLSVGLYLMISPPKNTLTGENTYAASEGEDESPTADIAAGQVVVDIAGGVSYPGVYWLDNGAMIEDAINAAGGLSGTADLDGIAYSINRAELVADHSKIYIPRIGDNQIVYVNPPAYSPANPLTSSPASLININIANTKELENLPGIGAVLAQRIIDYRLQNGLFISIDELKQVPGIGESKFNGLKDLVTI